MNQDNPYQVLRAAFSGSAGHSDGPCTGRLLGVSPLTVQMGGLTLTGADLTINPDLLARQATATGPDGQNYGVTIPSSLAVGDTVLIVPLGSEPVYHILSKVVTL